jgi:predicted TIM-barrel fold metal-dependent hydrolase
MPERSPLELSRRQILKAGGALAATSLLDACCLLPTPRRGAGTIDAHVHLFDLHYLYLEAGAVLWDRACGHYPRGLAAPTMLAAPTRGSTRDLFAWINSLVKALAGPEGANLDAALRGLRTLPPGAGSAAAMAHMMDIYYLFANPLGPGERLMLAPEPRALRALTATELESARRQLDAELTREGVPPEWQKTIRAQLVDPVLEMRSGGLFETPGFRHHRRALEELVAKRPGELYAFFAVDPRRRGAVAEVTEGRKVGTQRPFHGVKLYPMLGYHPQCAELEPLFDWCSQTATPIVSHCGATGFPPWAPDREQLGHPEKFRPILASRKGLRIDFAHFGWMEEGWARGIIALMKDFPGQVFTDLAAYKDPAQAGAFKRDYWDRERDLLRAHTMLGSDFDVMLVTPPHVTLEAYYRPFLAAFSDGDLAAMTTDVPRRFLGLG